MNTETTGKAKDIRRIPQVSAKTKMKVEMSPTTTADSLATLIHANHHHHHHH